MKNEFFIIFNILFLINLLFFSCFSPRIEYEQLKKEYSIYITPLNIPPSIKKDLPYKISVKIFLLDRNLNWSLCLASFRSLAFDITGKICTNKEEEGIGDIYEIDLPKDGYIFIKKPEYILSEYENIIVNFCYNYYSILSLEGCFSKNRICDLNVVGSYPVDGIIKINKAESYYNETDNSFYIRLYILIELPEEVYVNSFSPVEKECFIKEYLDRFKTLYEIKYGDKKHQSEIILKLNTLNQIVIPLRGFNYETEKFYVEIKFYYNIIKRVLLGYTRIEK